MKAPLAKVNGAFVMVQWIAIMSDEKVQVDDKMHKLLDEYEEQFLFEDRMYEIRSENIRGMYQRFFKDSDKSKMPKDFEKWLIK